LFLHSQSLQVIIMASFSSVLLLSLLFTSVLAQFDGDMLNKAQFAVGLGKRSLDDTFSRAQIPMGFGKRSVRAPIEELPVGRNTRAVVVGPRGEEAVQLPMGSRIFLFH
ncbi:hypothetical protein PFISCL1PPCAC_27325, partial [Pristionchus fissidentatus]